MTPDRIKDTFSYESPHDIAEATKHQVMPLPPHPPDPGVPVFWTTWDGGSQYLVNDSGEVLPSVVVEIGGFETTEADALTNMGERIRYERVQQGEAVKINALDPMDDGDAQVILYIDSPAWGPTAARLTRIGRNRQRMLVVLWDTGEAGRHAQVQHHFLPPPSASETIVPNDPTMTTQKLADRVEAPDSAEEALDLAIRKDDPRSLGKALEPFFGFMPTDHQLEGLIRSHIMKSGDPEQALSALMNWLKKSADEYEERERTWKGSGFMRSMANTHVRLPAKMYVICKSLHSTLKE